MLSGNDKQLDLVSLLKGVLLRRLLLLADVLPHDRGDVEQGRARGHPQRILVLQDPAHGSPARHYLRHTNLTSGSGTPDADSNPLLTACELDM